MAIVLYNPTNEDLRTQYVGEDVIIEGELGDYYDAENKRRPARCKVRVDDARGRHVLNVLGPRGLVTLEYGDEGDGESKKADQGRQRNHDFKYKQVIDFNTLNEQRFQSKLAYLKPTKQIAGYAKELGIEIRQPYAVEDAARRDVADAVTKQNELRDELRQKDAQLEEMRDQMVELTGQVKSLLAAVGKQGQTQDAKDSISGKWATLGAKVLIPWAQKHWEQIQLLPDDDFKDLNDRFVKVYGKSLPSTAEELEAVAA